MSFLIDPPLLYLNGELYGRSAPEGAQGGAAKAAGAATIAVFWAAGAALYMDRGWTRPLWRLFGSRNGRDFMVNSGVLGIDVRRAGWPTHAVSLLILATYPFWLALGYRHGRRARA